MILRGIGWNHDRCMAPLEASIQEFRKQHPNLQIQWDRRSLAHFGEGRMEDLIEHYDLLVYDHPYCGAVARNGWLVDLSRHLSTQKLEDYKKDTLGPCWESYHFDGGVWALPIDAAAQVSSCRTDLMVELGASVPSTLEEVMALALAIRGCGKWVALPLVPIDAICTFLTLLANAGHPVGRFAAQLADDEIALWALEWIRETAGVVYPSSLSWNPINCYDHMISNDDVVYVPFAFGYSNYSRRDVANRLTFVDIPGLPGRGPAGALLGGAGIGVSARSKSIELAIAYADFLSSPEYQAGPYTENGGQPGSLRAWTNEYGDRLTGGFFSGTLQTLQQSYLRPAFDGFIPFFRDSGVIINRFAGGEGSTREALDQLKARYDTAFQTGA